MKIFIDDEEVLCNSTMKINKQLANTNSVILNNVYPKSWEEDRDYTSNFYMPKDYSRCEIKDETITTETEYDLSNNIQELESRYIGGNNHKMQYYVSSKSIYIKLIPGLTYKVNFTNNFNGNVSVYECDNLNIGETASALITLTSGASGDYEITPTKEFIIVTNEWNSTSYVDCNSISIKTSDDLIFSGIVKNSGNINLNPRFPHYSTLQILDYETFLSEGDTLNYVLEKQPILSMLREIAESLEGFMVGTVDIESTEEIGPYNCNEKTPFDVLQYIAEITGSIWFTKTINKDITLINFYSTDNLPKAENIEYTQDYFEGNNITDIEYSYNTKDYRNKQIITNPEATSNITQVEQISYNGSSLKTSYPISSIVSIKSGNKTYSTALNMASSLGVYADFYYSYGSNEIVENKDFRDGTVFRVEYYTIVTSRQVAYNQTEVTRINEQTGRNGIISRYEKRKDTANETALSQIAQTYLDYKGVPEIQIVVKSHQKDLFDIGTVVFFNGPLEDLKTNYLVINKEINMITTGNQQEIFYTYKLSSSFNDENAINFFDNQRRKLEGDIKEGEYIPIYIDMPSSTNIIFYDLELEEEEIPKSVLDGELDMEI